MRFETHLNVHKSSIKMPLTRAEITQRYREAHKNDPLFKKRKRDADLKYRLSHREKSLINNRRNHFRKKFGFTLEERAHFIAANNNQCQICFIRREDLGEELCIDHMHKMNIIRGLLCRQCNLGLGHLHDSLFVGRAALAYLQHPGTPPHLVPRVIRYTMSKAEDTHHRSIKSHVGIDHFQYLHILSVQQHKCAICKTTDFGKKNVKHFLVDHHHASGSIRGLLCFHCNTAIGCFNDQVFLENLVSAQGTEKSNLLSVSSSHNMPF
jgi:hypothetical protein